VNVITSVALARLPGVSCTDKKALIDRFGTADQVLQAARTGRDVDESVNIRLALVRRDLDLVGAEQELKRLGREGAWVRGYGYPNYPGWLAEISDPPLVLFGKGTLPPDDAVTLGVVGPRRPSGYGARIARMLSRDLAREGLVLVSGMARGIDAIAHDAALKEKMPTVAVLGCGIDRVYPPEHALLKERIIEQGAVITEFFMGEPPRPGHFPKRNRIISGLSRGVLIVEAGEKSGARITARLAAEQSREVFAVPGPIDSPLSFSTNELISQGAKLVASSADVLSELVPHRVLKERNAKLREESELPEMTLRAHKLLRHLTCDTPLAVDDLVRKQGDSVSHVLATLIELEMKGVVQKQPDARYLRVLM